MANLRRGSRGDDVKDLQTLLNSVGGYNLDVDGSFGPKTLAAVRDYQSKNNLTVDGIAGVNTMNALRNASSTKTNAAGGGAVPGNAATQAPKTPSGQTWLTPGTTPSGYVPIAPTSINSEYLAQYETGRPEYSEDPAVTEALRLLREHEANKPGEYQGTYEQQIQQIVDNINNRGPFSYDFNADPLYQQYRQQYVNQGQQAMQDTMGNAAALSGGYGNSYAQTAGQQAYNAYLGQLNNVIPELQQAAYSRYQDELNNDYNRLNMYQNLDQAAYNRYRDTVGDYYNDLDYFYRQYGDMSDRDYNRYLNDAQAWENDRAYWYGKAQDELAQNNWMNQFAYQQSQDNQDQQNWEQEMALKIAAMAGSGGSGGSRGPGSGNAEDYDTWYRNNLNDVMSILNGNFKYNGKNLSGVDAAIAYIRTKTPNISTDDVASLINTAQQARNPYSKSATGGLTQTPLYQYAQAAYDSAKTSTLPGALSSLSAVNPDEKKDKNKNKGKGGGGKNTNSAR